jgi:hypothetical protein
LLGVMMRFTCTEKALGVLKVVPAGQGIIQQKTGQEKRQDRTGEDGVG